MVRVFISYSHDDDSHVQQVNELAYLLTDLGGLEITIDLWEPHPSEGWTAWMERGIRRADYVLIVCSQGYFDKIDGGLAPDHGKGVKWEGRIIRNLLYTSGSDNDKFVPVLLQSGKSEHLLTPLLDSTYYPLYGKEGLDKKGLEKLYRFLTQQPEYERPVAKKTITPFPSRRGKGSISPSHSPAISPFFNGWPSTSGLFVGREKELQLLDAAWKSPSCHLVSLVAMGGTGKTALVNHWLDQMQRENYRGAARVIGWSFYSQGAGADKQSSAETFLEIALKQCGESDPPTDAWARGQRLAELLSSQPTLLLLDGVEPLQHPRSTDQHLSGKLKDPGLESLLTHLARQGPNQSLCLISTRIAIPLLTRFSDSAQQQGLEQLDPATGAALLLQTGVRGTEADLQAASREFQGHALALTLLGRYLSRRHGGDISKRSEIPPLEQDRKDGRAARRLMATYENWLAETPELDFLRLLGLFDRPMTPQALAALLAEPAIPGLTERLGHLNRTQALDLLENLRDLRLLARPEEEDPSKALAGESTPPTHNFSLSTSLDTHPLIREHFDAVLKTQQPEAYRAAHLRLYEHYRALPEKDQPDTLPEMEPLFAAVAHGVKAGRVQEAFDDIYWQRITRKGAYYLTRQLGAFASDLGVLGSFFVQPWSQPHPELRRAVQLICLAIAGFNLRALGRPQEAVGAMESGLAKEVVEAQKAGPENDQRWWKNAAISASNLSELQLALGRVAAAVDSARRSVDYADRSGDEVERMVNRTTLAEALTAAGQPAEAGVWFREAEEMQKKRQPSYPRLYSLQGYCYATWLLEQGEVAETAERAAYALEIAKRNGWLLDMSLDTLSLGRAALLSGDLPQARTHLEAAVAGLRRAGQNEFVIVGLLARAAWARLQGDWSQAQADLEETCELIERTGFRLYLVDYQLERARCCRAGGVGFESQEARAALEKAAQAAAEMGYQRRDHEIARLQAEIPSG